MIADTHTEVPRYGAQVWISYWERPLSAGRPGELRFDESEQTLAGWVKGLLLDGSFAVCSADALVTLT